MDLLLNQKSHGGGLMIQRYFLILTTRHTGGAWLAKLLNSHFEVMCFHEFDFITYSLGLPPRTVAWPVCCWT
jgi:hypothetical protein